MQWYVAKGSEVVGPVDGATMERWGREGLLIPGTHIRDGQSAWTPIEQSPFAALVRAPGRGAKAGHVPKPLLYVFGGIGALVAVTLIISALSKPPPKVVQPAPVATPIQAKPAAIAPVVVEPPEALDPSTPRLRPSKSELVATFEDFGISLKSSPLADGTPRLLGTHPDNLTSVEVVGRGDFAERASLMMGLAQDHPVSLLRNTAMMMVFMRDTGWEKGKDWVTATMRKGGGKITKNGVIYEVVGVADTGLFVLAATPVGAVKGKK